MTQPSDKVAIACRCKSGPGSEMDWILDSLDGVHFGSTL
jgi:hypothetical protein